MTHHAHTIEHIISDDDDGKLIRSLESKSKKQKKKKTHNQLRILAGSKGFKTSFPGSNSKRLTDIMRACGVFSTPKTSGMLDVPNQYINYARFPLYTYNMMKQRDNLRVLLKSITIQDLSRLMQMDTFKQITTNGFSKVNLNMKVQEKTFYYEYYMSLLVSMGVQLHDASTYDNDNVCGLKNYAKNMGWERTSGTPTQFASSTNPQIYGLVVGYYARFLEEHKLVTNKGMLKQFTATGECKDAVDEHGQPIPATIACLNLRLLLYNTKLKLPDVKRSFNHTDCNLKYVPRDRNTGKPMLMGQLQVIHVLTDSHTSTGSPIWNMNFVNLRQEMYYLKWKTYEQAEIDKMYCVANKNNQTMKQPSASSVPVKHFCDVQHFDAISDRMPLGEVKAGDVVLFDTLTAHQVIEHGQLGTSAECVRACEYPLFTSPYLHGENCLQTPTNVIKAFTLNEQPKYWSHAYTGNQIGFDAIGLTPNDISTMGRKLKPLLHMTVAPKTPLSSALLNGISVFDNQAHLQMMEPLLNKLKSTHTLSNTEQIVPQQWIHDHVEDDINLMKQDLDRIKQKLHICNTGKQFGNVVLP